MAEFFDDCGKICCLFKASLPARMTKEVLLSDSVINAIASTAALADGSRRCQAVWCLSYCIYVPYMR